MVVLLALVPAALGCFPPDSPRPSQQAKREAVAPPVTTHGQSDVRLPSVDEPPRDTPTAVRTADGASKERPTPSLDELLLFFPAKYPSGDWQPDGLRFEDVWFEAEDGTRLHGWYCPSQNPRAVVLFAHGNAGNLSHRARVLARLQEQLQVSVLIFDYRGYGRSDGVPSVPGILQDARAARTVLAERTDMDESAIVLMGRSLGGAVAVQLAAELPPRGLVLESTFSSLKDVATHHYPRLAWLVPSTKLESAAVVAGYRGPLLQSHGDADQTIPILLGRKVFDAAGGPKTFVTIPGADHNDPQTEEYYLQFDRFIGGLSN